MEENNYIDKQLNDHECRLRRLEESDVAQRVQLANIEKSQVEIKLIISDQSKEYQNMFNNFTVQMLDYFKDKEKRESVQKTKEKQKELEVEKENNKVNNQIRFYKTKQFWGIVTTISGGILGGILTYFGLK